MIKSIDFTVEREYLKAECIEHIQGSRVIYEWTKCIFAGEILKGDYIHITEQIDYNPKIYDLRTIEQKIKAYQENMNELLTNTKRSES